jgi:hypothetical protein
MIAIATPHDQPVFVDVVRNLVIFRRCLVQALDIPDGSPLLQLPHVDESQNGILKDAPPFREIVSGKHDNFLDQLKLSKEQRLDVDAFCRHAPLLELSCEVAVQDEEGISCTDVATLTVTLTRTNWRRVRLQGQCTHLIFPCRSSRNGGSLCLMSVIED